MSYRTNRLDERVIKLLKDGGVGFMPSDTIYGLSCRALDERAVERIYRLKKRDTNKPLIVLIASISQLAPLGVDNDQLAPAAKYWPGPLTVICPAPHSPDWLQLGTKSLAVRLPGGDKLRSLIEQVGPIVSTSANLQGRAVVSSVEEAYDYFTEELDFYVDAGDFSNRRPSTLVRTRSGQLEVIRPGAAKLLSRRRLKNDIG